MFIRDAVQSAALPPAETIAVPDTLTDRFGRRHTYLRISITDRCNLRCSYCMPPEGIDWKSREELLTFSEIRRIAAVLVEMGIEKIRITGGEPTVRSGLEGLIADLAALDGVKTMALTTNGLRMPQQAAGLKRAGLQAVNISLDTLQRDRFLEITRRDALDGVLAGIDAALQTGFESLKLNVVVMAGVNDDEILDFVDWIRDKPMNVRFIEYMPFKDNAWREADVFPYLEMKRMIETRYVLEPLAAEPGAVARDFSLAGHRGTVSFITSMTDSFCGTCNRLRLTADGQIKSCLFHPAEISLRKLLRGGGTDDELRPLIRSAVLQKQEAHPPMAALLNVENRAMIEIGG